MSQPTGTSEKVINNDKLGPHYSTIDTVYYTLYNTGLEANHMHLLSKYIISVTMHVAMGGAH